MLISGPGQDWGCLAVNLQKGKAHELAVHTAGYASNKGQEGNKVVVSVGGTIRADFLGSTLLK